MASPSALSYEEPGIQTILILSGFLLVLNFANAILDRILYCGLIGQIFIGVAWGMPGAQWLTLEAQEFIQQLGYLGLLFLVYEGNMNLLFLHGCGFEHDDGGVHCAVVASGLRCMEADVSHHLALFLEYSSQVEWRSI
jgi:hypothetical protein